MEEEKRIEEIAREVALELECDSWFYDNPDYMETKEQHEDRQNYYKTIAKIVLKKQETAKREAVREVLDEIKNKYTSIIGLSDETDLTKKLFKELRAEERLSFDSRNMKSLFLYHRMVVDITEDVLLYLEELRKKYEVGGK